MASAASLHVFAQAVRGEDANFKILHPNCTATTTSNWQPLKGSTGIILNELDLGLKFRRILIRGRAGLFEDVVRVNQMKGYFWIYLEAAEAKKERSSIFAGSSLLF